MIYNAAIDSSFLSNTQQRNPSYKQKPTVFGQTFIYQKAVGYFY